MLLIIVENYKMKKFVFGPQWTTYGNQSDMQMPFDVAVVIPSIGRQEIIRALSSIFIQNVNRIQVLIGIDKPVENLLFLHQFLKTCPNNITVNLFYPGYSTSARHGGVTPAQDGGALRSVLTQLANSKYVAYLDDDNWWGESHLSDLLLAIENRAWAFSLRYLMHPESEKIICLDEWESAGVGRGIYAQVFGGFVDPNCLMIDKELCWDAVACWSFPLSKGTNTADRNIFNFLKNHSEPGETKTASCFYVVNPKDGLQAYILSVIDESYHGLLNVELPQEKKDLISKRLHSSVFFNLGASCYRQADWAGAIERYDAAISINPDYAEAHNNRGIALYQLHRYELAISSYDKAISIKPEYSEAHNNRGIALFQLKQYESAIASYDAAISINAEFVGAYNNRGIAHNELKHYDLAIASYDAAIKISPEYAEAYNNRGIAHIELKHYDLAIADYDRAIQLSPNFDLAHNNRKRALELAIG